MLVNVGAHVFYHTTSLIEFPIASFDYTFKNLWLKYFLNSCSQRALNLVLPSFVLL